MNFLQKNQNIFREKALSYVKRVGGRIKILVIAGPSCSGKTTIIKGLLKRYPEILTNVVELSTRPKRKGTIARKNVSIEDFPHHDIVLLGKSGAFPCAYTGAELLKAFKKGKIIIFESMSRLEKLEKLLGEKTILSLAVGLLPPGENMQEILNNMHSRLLQREKKDQIDIQDRLDDARKRIIPTILKKSKIVLRSDICNYEKNIEKISDLFFSFLIQKNDAQNN